MRKAVLAFNGSLETAICIPFLKSVKSLGVIAFSADFGVGDCDRSLAEHALAMGADSSQIENVRTRFTLEYVFPAIRANAFFHSGFFLSAALSRPLLAEEMVKIANEEDSCCVAHGCSPMSNDQARFEAAFSALAPDLKVVAPLVEWSLKSKAEKLEYLKKHGFGNVPLHMVPFNVDYNLWGRSVRSKELNDSSAPPAEDLFTLTANPLKAPGHGDEVEIGFKAGLPITLNGEQIRPDEIIDRLNRIGGLHGVGRYDTIGNMVSGLKVRRIYEGPAAAILSAAKKALEQITLSPNVEEFSSFLSRRYGQLIFEGFWFSELRTALDAYFQCAQRFVEGKVVVRLFKGSSAVVSRSSEETIFNPSLVAQEIMDMFDKPVLRDFTEYWGMAQRVEAFRRLK